jgi:phosphoserine phosphatase
MQNNNFLNWQLTQPVDAVVFDCDGTLSQIEGINQLARNNGVEREVGLLTEMAMSKTGITAEIYKKRLDLVKPTAAQLAKVGDAYYQNLSPDVDRIIDVLQQLNKTVYVISAGIQSALEDFAQRLHIPTAQVFGVEVYFDKQGDYHDYDKNAPLANQQGKRKMLEKFRLKHRQVVFIGDGMNDLEAADAADRFIGYGGAYFRQNIADLCDFYITGKSFMPLLPLCLTAAEIAQLSAAQQKIYQMGLAQINQGLVLIKQR